MPDTVESQRRIAIQRIAHDFCLALLNTSPAELISKYMGPNPKITEHGPNWAKKRLPFLGKTFEGQEGCAQYFQLLSETLKMELNQNSFPSLAGCAADPNAEARTGADKLAADGKGIVSVVGKGRFISIRTGRSWEEEFIYRFSGFDEKGGIGHWEIWADPLSAWVAVGDESI